MWEWVMVSSTIASRSSDFSSDLTYREPEREKTRYKVMKKQEYPGCDEGVPCNLCSLLYRALVKDRNVE